MSDDDDDYFSDAKSFGSASTLTSVRNKTRFLSLSHFTIYHSAEGLPEMENPEAQDSALIRSGDKPDKTWGHFLDGKTVVDFVLAYVPDDNAVKNQKREVFEGNLVKQGLKLEKDTHQRIHFVKIHVPREVLCLYCELMKLKMPIKKIHGQEHLLDSDNFVEAVKTRIGRMLQFVKLDPKYFPERDYELTCEFSRDRHYLFETDRPDFFSQTVRISVVSFILERQRFNEDESAVFDIGINRLIAEDAYKAAYPLHDGDIAEEGKERYLLFTQWAQVTKWINYQPIDNIKDYFGVKFALYFTWLGFYTHMLIVASVMGILCFFYGLITLSSNTLSNDICDPKTNITMCPQCDSNCDYWKLEETCLKAKVTYLFDNNFTVAFAVLMSIWGTIYLELWKRYSANITHRWGLTGFDHQAEHPRPEYLAKLTNCEKKKVNYVTALEEPIVPFWRVRLPFTVLSFSIVTFLIFLAGGAVFGVVLYRMSQLTSNSFFGSSDEMAYKSVALPCSAAFMNLFFITILNLFYDRVAVYLTEMELLRTQTEFDESLTLKIYLFQFVNFYSSIFYIAFLKGKFVGYPSKYNRIFGYRQEECSPGGCFVELFIQLAIIMIGKQALASVMEMVIPFCMKWYNTFMIKTGLSKDNDDNINCCNQWTEDYKLLEWGPRGLFDEYLEMILQYGFVTIFVSAFPLAPFFALLNNILEMRLDAKKFLKYYRRPVPRRSKSIGVWYTIMDILGRISVVTNAFMIAFSSNFIPRMVYMMTVSPDKTDQGFLEHSLAYFDTKDFQFGIEPKNSAFGNITICRYPEYRNPPWQMPEDRKYKRPEIYWHIMAARLAFVVVFQNVVSFVMLVVQWAIPDVPRKLGDQIKREAVITNDIIIQREAAKARVVRLGEDIKGDIGTFIHQEKSSPDKISETVL